MRFTLAFPFLLALLFAACASTDSGADLTQSVPHTGEDCICGAPEADLFGCYCEDCLLRGGNPDNPDCVCLPMAPRSEIDRSLVSLGGSGLSPGALVGLDSLVLKKGGRVRGTVLADDGETIVFRLENGTEARYTYDQLNTRSVYKLLLAKTSRDDAASEYRLASFAAEIGLYAHARRHFGYAADADPGLRDDVVAALADLDRLAAESELASAREALAAGKEKDGLEHLKTVVTEFPAEPVAGEAAELLASVENQRRVRAEAEAARERDEDRADALRAPERRLERAREHNHAGLTAGSSSRAVREFEAGLAETDRGSREVERAREKADDDSSLLAALKRLEGQLTEVVVDICMNLASTEMVKSDYRDALSAANRALAADPGNSRALRMRARIETEANDWWGSDGRSGDSGDSAAAYYYGYRRGQVLRARPGNGYRIGYGAARMGHGGGRFR